MSEEWQNHQGVLPYAGWLSEDKMERFLKLYPYNFIYQSNQKLIEVKLTSPISFSRRCYKQCSLALHRNISYPMCSDISCISYRCHTSSGHYASDLQLIPEDV